MGEADLTERGRVAGEGAEAARARDRSLVIEVKDLEVGWGDVVLLRGVTFDVRRGEVFAVLGGSGCGKSTLLRYLVGLEEITKGEVFVAGRRNVDLDAGLPPFGVMFQGGALFGSSTVGENVELPLEEWTDLPEDAITAIAKAKLRLVGLEGAYEKFPSELSGGMRQRAAIARALALDPKLLFLDEPNAGLDPISSAEIDDLIETLNETLGVTVVLVTHVIESIFRIVDQCIMLHPEAQGIIARGEPRELAESADRRVSEFLRRTTAASTG